MSMKLDQSLDDISKATRAARGRGRPVRRTTKAKTAAPVGGVQKKTAVAKAKGPLKGPTSAQPLGESKIIVSGLPADVSEQQIKEYFNKTIGIVKKVLLSYGANGKSRGVATVTFNKVDSAHKAASQLNGTKVDNKPMSIEVVLGAAQAPAPAPAKGLADRIAKPKTATKVDQKKGTAKTAGPAAGKAAGKAKVARKGRTGRPKPKTAEELDAEMTDYFDGGANGAANGTTNGAAAPQAAPAGGDAMEDEVL